MSGEPRQFVDANILVYAHDVSAGKKRAAALDIISRLWESGTGCLSIQVLQELHVTLTRKVSRPLSLKEGREIVEALGRWSVHAPSPSDVLAAIDLQSIYKTGFWDAMILTSAAQMGCAVLWSEDLQSGRTYEGVLVRNPFG